MDSRSRFRHHPTFVDEREKGKGRSSMPIGHGVSSPVGHASRGKSLGALRAEGGGNPQLRLWELG